MNGLSSGPPSTKPVSAAGTRRPTLYTTRQTPTLCHNTLTGTPLPSTWSGG